MPIGVRKADGRPNNLRHGGYGTTEYVAWMNMLARCRNPNHPRYPIYGARGIRVCASWHDFGNFIADMGWKPAADLTIDRIDPDGNYEPGNCRWISFDANRRNRSGKYRITEQERQRRRDFARFISKRPQAFGEGPSGSENNNQNGKVRQSCADWLMLSTTGALRAY